jgi:hypothetical protein
MTSNGTVLSRIVSPSGSAAAEQVRDDRRADQRHAQRGGLVVFREERAGRGADAPDVRVHGRRGDDGGVRAERAVAHRDPLRLDRRRGHDRRALLHDHRGVPHRHRRHRAARGLPAGCGARLPGRHDDQVGAHRLDPPDDLPLGALSDRDDDDDGRDADDDADERQRRARPVRGELAAGDASAGGEFHRGQVAVSSQLSALAPLAES